MILLLRQTFNKSLDALIRPEVYVLGRSLLSFQVCGVTGFSLAILLAMILVIYQGLLPLVIAELAITAAIAFFGLVMATKIITGEEKIIYYHHEIVVMIMAAIFLWLTHQSVLPYLDITILGIGIFLFCGRIGCLMVGCCHGRPYAWGVCYRPEHAKAGFAPYLVGVRLFPIQAVESLWVFCVVVTGIMFILRGLQPGTALAWYVVAYDVGRFFFEFLRGDPDRPYLWGFSQPQWISIILMCFVVGAEFNGTLLFQWWHLVVTASILLLMITITLKRRFEKTARFELLHPRHIREVAEVLMIVNSIGVQSHSTRRYSETPKSNILTALHVACTSLGIQISAGKVKDLTGDIHHYTFSCRNGDMTEETARIIANLVLQLHEVNAKGELVYGNQHVFHLLVPAVIEKSQNDKPS